MSTLESRLKSRVADAGWRGVNTSLAMLGRALFRNDPRALIPRRLVVHLIGNIGDVVVAVPALMALRRRFPAAHITLLTSPGPKSLPGAAQLLSGVSYLDRLEVYYSDDVDSRSKQLALAHRVREWRPDLMIFLPSSLISPRRIFRNLAFARLVGPGAAFGYRLPVSPWFRRAQAETRERFPHEVDRILGSLAALGIDPSAPARFELGVPPEEDRNTIETILARSDGRPILAVCPGGKEVGQLWPAERFAAVSAQAKDAHDAQVCIIGGKNDGAAAAVIMAAVDDAIDMTGALSLLGTAELSRRAQCLLTNDTGPMHLAVAVGTRVCAIFSSWDYAGRWYPYGEGHTVFRAVPVCPVCLFNPARTDHCVSRIGVDEVARACLSILAP